MPRIDYWCSGRKPSVLFFRGCVLSTPYFAYELKLDGENAAKVFRTLAIVKRKSLQPRGIGGVDVCFVYNGRQLLPEGHISVPGITSTVTQHTVFADAVDVDRNSEPIRISRETTWKDIGVSNHAVIDVVLTGWSRCPDPDARAS